MMSRGSFRFSAWRLRYVIVPAWPSASQRSNSSACGLRSMGANPTAEKPSPAPTRFISTLLLDASARRFCSTVFTISQPHRLAPPAREIDDVRRRRNGLRIAVGGEHAPLHVFAGRQGQE